MKILLVEDHPIFRFGVRALLQQRWPDALIGEAASLGEALATARREPWTLALVDLNLADAEGVEVVSQLRRAAPDTRLLVLSLNAEAAYARRVLQLGAAGYLAKDRATEELVNAVERIAAGGRYISQSLADQLLDLATGASGGGGHEELSNQEYRVMLLLAAGRRVGEIAEEMTLSPKTVSTYRTRILEKLNLGSNAELARYCQSRDLTADGV